MNTYSIFKQIFHRNIATAVMKMLRILLNLALLMMAITLPLVKAEQGSGYDLPAKDPLRFRIMEKGDCSYVCHLRNSAYCDSSIGK